MHRYENAACWGRTALFFSDSRIDQRHAADICDDCIYKQQCYDDAEARGEKDGIHGGIKFDGRKRVDPKRPRKPRQRVDRPAPTHEQRACPICDEVFITKNSKQIYCDKTCADIAHSEKHLDRYHAKKAA